MLEAAEEPVGHPAEVRLLDVPVLDVVADAIREDVIDGQVEDPEAGAFDERARLAARVGVGDRAAGLRLRVLRDELLGPPERVPAPAS